MINFYYSSLHSNKERKIDLEVDPCVELWGEFIIEIQKKNFNKETLFTAGKRLSHVYQWKKLSSIYTRKRGQYFFRRKSFQAQLWRNQPKISFCGFSFDDEDAMKARAIWWNYCRSTIVCHQVDFSIAFKRLFPFDSAFYEVRFYYTEEISCISQKKVGHRW